MENIPVFTPSNIENIDSAIYEWINDELNIHVHTNEGYKKVPVKFSIPEVSSLVYDKDSVDNKNTLKYPVISVKRKGFTKPLKKELALQGSRFMRESSMYLTIHKKLNYEKTAHRANADSKRFAGTLNSKKIKTKKVIYTLYNIPIPTAVNVEYEISMISNFNIQMNDIVSPFIKYTNNINGFRLIRNGHVYECFIEESIQLTTPEDLSESSERTFEHTINLKVKGYIHDGEMNDKGPSIIETENAPEIIFKPEVVEN
jgi:hypothetical protein